MHWEPFSSGGSKRQRGNVDGGGVGAAFGGCVAWCEGGRGDEQEVMKGVVFEQRDGVGV